MLAKEMYCMKCHREKMVVGAQPVIFKNGSVALRGSCPSCHAASYRIVSKRDLRQNSFILKAKSHWSAKAFLITSIFIFGITVGGLIISYSF